MLRWEKCKHMEVSGEKYPCSECDSIVNDLFESKKQTNADRIRSMSDEKLAELLDSVDNGGIRALDVDYPCDECTQKTKCEDCFKEWLQSEVEE